MNQKTFSHFAGLIFLLVAVMYGLCLALRWEVVLSVITEADRSSTCILLLEEY